MPTIFKPKKKREIQSDKQQKRRKIYNSQLWKEIRVAYMISNPLCEICEMEGKTRLAEHCHHLISFLDVPDELMLNYAYDSNNLCSVCAECHNRIHNGDLKGCKSKDDIKHRLNLYDNNNQ